MAIELFAGGTNLSIILSEMLWFLSVFPVTYAMSDTYKSLPFLIIVLSHSVLQL
jgi:hypothetical protein